MIQLTTQTNVIPEREKDILPKVKRPAHKKVISAKLQGSCLFKGATCLHINFTRVILLLPLWLKERIGQNQPVDTGGSLKLKQEVME